MRRGIMMVLVVLILNSSLKAGLAPHNVLIVVNDASWTSKAVANEYVKLRQIPPTNVVYLNDVPVTSQITVDEFRLKILKPLILTMVDRGIEQQIHCIAYSTDFPWRIDLREEIKKRLGDEQKLPEKLTPYGSLTGMTYLFDFVFKEDIDYLQLTSNAYFRDRADSLRPFQSNEIEDLQFREALRLAKNKKWKEASTILSRLINRHNRVALLWYHHAYCLAQNEQPDEAIKALEKAIQNGWKDVEKTEKDENFEPIRDHEEFKKLLELMRRPIFDTEPAMAFSHHRAFKVPFREEPVHYMLSIMLGVTEGRGNSVAEILNSLTLSAGADHTIPAASFYFTRTKDVRSTTRQMWFESAVTQLEATGKHAVIVDEPLPQFRRDVGGVMAGVAGFDWPKSQSVIKPGAICEHLTSYGGMMSDKQGQTPISEWIRYGAAGTSGTVYEPYAIQAKFPTAFLHVFYARGFSLVESFYLSVQAPYQLLILGDPLCQPWSFPPRFEVAFEENRELDRSIPLLATPVDSIDRFLIVVDGVEKSSTAPGIRDFLRINELAEGAHSVMVIGIDRSPAGINHVKEYPFVVNRLFKSIRLSVVKDEEDEKDKAKAGKEPPCCRVDEKVTVKLSCERATEIQLFHNSRKLGTIEESSGTIEVPGETLGLGEVELVAVGIGEGWTIRSEPLTVKVTAPPLRKPLGKPLPRPQKPGLLLTVGGRSQIIEDLVDRQWLTRAEVKPDEEFKLEGYFEVDKDDLYQFQIDGNLPCQIFLNGVEIELPDLEQPFRCVPLSLAFGNHHLVVTGTMQEKGELLFSLGNQGRQILDSRRFQTAPWSR